MTSNTPPQKEPASPVVAEKTTPMMAQYLSIKQEAGDALLFYRMGDFYELFFDDAVAAAEALEITLTKRGKHAGQDIPMCGVPWHSHESYLERLIREGFKVAICEQTEDPAEAKKRGSKSVVARAIVRVVTPGTLTEDTLLDAGQNNFLGALGREGEAASIAWADVSTGELYVRATSLEAAPADLASLSLSEIICVDPGGAPDPWTALLDGEARSGGPVVSLQPPPFFSAQSGERRVKEAFAVASLDGFGTFSKADLSALGALLSYIELTQVGKQPNLRPPRRSDAGAVMAIDQATRASLEILQTQSGSRKGALVSAVNRTVTGPGARMLAARLSAPLIDPALINGRLDAVSYFVDHASMREKIRVLLKQTPDMARALSRLSLDRGGPRDLLAICDGLSAARAVAKHLSDDGGVSPPPPAILGLWRDLEAQDQGGFSALINQFKSALEPSPPMLARDGGFIAKGYDAGLDEVRVLRDESRRLIAGLEAQYKDQTGVKSLKIKHNNVLGFFVETPTAHGDKLMTPPHDEAFIHRQTLASAVRFTTGDLADLDAKIARARDEALARELEIFKELAASCLERAADISTAAEAVAGLDVAAACAELSVEERYVRPIVDDSFAFDIEAGRHPVVEQAVARESGAQFVSNNCVLSTDDVPHLWLVTGPNMAGKSTFLRQNALIAVLAQAGLFVPAARAHIGVADRVFSRVGASDDLARGRSTFMVEMVETAAILNQAGPRAIVVLDEIGRGTSTFDGLSIAWAAVEHLHTENRCRGLFATHYHELTALSETLPRLKNVSMRVREWKGAVVFLHEVGEGPADRSYGVQVARLAGLPQSVVQRAGAVLKLLEAQKQDGPGVGALPLFAAAPDEPSANEAPAPASTKALEALRQTDPDALSPREALDALYKLKALADE